MALIVEECGMELSEVTGRWWRAARSWVEGGGVVLLTCEAVEFCEGVCCLVCFWRNRI